MAHGGKEGSCLGLEIQQRQDESASPLRRYQQKDERGLRVQTFPSPTAAKFSWVAHDQRKREWVYGKCNRQCIGFARVVPSHGKKMTVDLGIKSRGFFGQGIMMDLLGEIAKQQTTTANGVLRVYGCWNINSDERWIRERVGCWIYSIEINDQR